MRKISDEKLEKSNIPQGASDRKKVPVYAAKIR